MHIPQDHVSLNSWDFFTQPMIVPSGFREYDARWQYPQQINLPGVMALGKGLGTQIRLHNLPPQIIVANDYREYSLAVKQALIIGLMQAGIEVLDIGVGISPLAYFAQFHLNCKAVAMVTASHNPNGWTGVKMGFSPPCTHGPEEMSELREIVLTGQQRDFAGGAYRQIDGIREAYIDDLVGDFKMSRPLKVVCATGNGTASAFAPDILRRIGVDVIERHCALDYTFPHYNPNPEAMEMLHDMSACVKEHAADLAFGFDGDGDRCGVVDDKAHEMFADKLGLILMRDYARDHPGRTVIADVKSTGLFLSDSVLKQANIKVEYWKTGHSHMKRRIRDTGALAGFEKSGHHFLGDPIGKGYDCAMRVAVEVCKLMDRRAGASMSDLLAELPRTWSTPTLAPYCADDAKYDALDCIVERIKNHIAAGHGIAGQKVTQVITVNGARIILDNGSWGLVRASSNTPNLVVVCESVESKDELRKIFQDINGFIQQQPQVGAYDQSIDF